MRQYVYQGAQRDEETACDRKQHSSHVRIIAKDTLSASSSHTDNVFPFPFYSPSPSYLSRSTFCKFTFLTLCQVEGRDRQGVNCSACNGGGGEESNFHTISQWETSALSPSPVGTSDENRNHHLTASQSARRRLGEKRATRGKRETLSQPTLDYQSEPLRLQLLPQILNSCIHSVVHRKEHKTCCFRAVPHPELNNIILNRMCLYPPSLEYVSEAAFKVSWQGKARQVYS